MEMGYMKSYRVILLFALFLFLFIIIYFYSKKKEGTISSFLIYTALYGTTQYHLFFTLQNSIVNICESGIFIKVVVHYTEISDTSLLLKRKYCQKLKIYVPFEFIKCNSSVGTYLTAQHRYHISALGKEINDYDFIGYVESDVILETKHLSYYLASYKLMKGLGKYYIPGFIRYVVYRDSNGEIYRRTPDYIDFVVFRNVNGVCFIEMQDAFSSFWLMPTALVKERVKDEYFYELPSNFFRKVWVKEYFSFFYWKKFIHYYVMLDNIDSCFMNHASNKDPFYVTSFDVESFYKQIGLCETEGKERKIVHQCRGSKKIDIHLQNNSCNYKYNEDYVTLAEHADYYTVDHYKEN